MANNDKGASLPVESPSIQAELQAAFVRIADVPAGSTLVDQIDSDLWNNGVLGSIEAGNPSTDSDELDSVDAESMLTA